MEDYEEAIKYYEKRVNLTYMGYYEELFISYMKLADLNDIIGKHDLVCYAVEFDGYALYVLHYFVASCGLHYVFLNQARLYRPQGLHYTNLAQRMLLHRVEPMLRLAEFYLYDVANYPGAYNWTTMALAQGVNHRTVYILQTFAVLNISFRAGYPTFEQLFVDKDAYDYGRYHLHCQAAYRMKDYQGSIDACEVAMKFPSRVCCCGYPSLWDF